MSPRIITSCKQCSFALYNEGGITQYGCSANGMLQKYKDIGVVVEAYDEDKEFFIINGYQCMFKRSLLWYNKNANKPNLYLAALNEIPFAYHVVVINRDNMLTEQTLDNIATFDIKPKKITVIRPYGALTDGSIIQKKLTSLNIPWKLESILNSDIQSWHQMCQLALASNTIHYIVFIDEGTLLNHRLLSVVKQQTVTDLLQFALLEGDGVKIIAFNVWKYYKLTGDPNYTIIDNIHKDNECQKIKDIMINYHL